MKALLDCFSNTGFHVEIFTALLIFLVLLYISSKKYVFISRFILPCKNSNNTLKILVERSVINMPCFPKAERPAFQSASICRSALFSKMHAKDSLKVSFLSSSNSFLSLPFR